MGARRASPVLLALSLALAAAGCGRESGAGVSLESRTPPQIAPRFWAPPGWTVDAVEAEGVRVRYGVAAPVLPSRGHVVVLVDRGESGEVWFETAKALISRGWTVWTVEGGERPLARAEAAARLVERVVRPEAGRPVVVVAQGAAAAEALAVARTSPRVSGLHLHAPSLAEPRAEEARRQRSLGFGGVRPTGQGGWRRPEGDLTGRATLPAVWALANPDLRRRAPDWREIAERADLIETAAAPQRPTLMRAPDPAARRLCDAAPACVAQDPPSPSPAPHLAPDAEREAWTTSLIDFAERLSTERVHGL